MLAYRAVVIGCGRIGVSFESDDAEAVLTHAKAFSLHPEVCLTAVMDLDGEIAEAAGSRWRCEYYSDFQRIIREQQPDIISICVPDEFHYEYLLQCLDLKPKAVVAEKPLTLDIKESREVVEKYKNADIPLFVNYTRRYDSFMQSLQRRIETGELGEILNTTIKYTKGMLHNGSHAVDLASFLFGRFLSGRPLSSVLDYSEHDPTLSAVLRYMRCPEVLLTACDGRMYSIFEIDIMAEKGRVILEQSGLRYREYIVRKDPVFAGYRDLVPVIESATGLNQSILNLVDNVVQHLDNGSRIICSGDDALVAQEICTDLLAQNEELLRR